MASLLDINSPELIEQEKKKMIKNKKANLLFKWMNKIKLKCDFLGTLENEN